MEREGPRSASSAPPSSLRWEILRGLSWLDASSQVDRKIISRRTSSHFNMIPRHFISENFSGALDVPLEVRHSDSKRDISVLYKLPVMTAHSLVLTQRMENEVDLKDFEISNQFNIDNTGLLCCWPSEDILAHFCLKNKDIFSGKKVIELGSGYGLAGLAIAAGTDAREVVISDGNPQVVDYLQLNIDTNIRSFGDKKVKAMTLHWDQKLDSCMLSSFDAIVASDCTFFKEFHEALALTVKSLLKNSERSTAILLSPRRGDSLDKFLVKVEEIGMRSEVVENYDPAVWQRHLMFLSGEDKSWPNYDEDHFYPLLVKLSFGDPTEAPFLQTLPGN
ncbi:unnamed protein product [Spirodela intermedia]|uniref:Calmodulin-lysine N-methyltransferase n=1 Tax=Spirodela intermedia TaxID=51605 RepID=A0A7I8IGH9_SPIIN|nr:unnamed protein product [Spirodela intermedia]CAA6655972.1 unnamed protein product [Spirodela intermedia]